MENLYELLGVSKNATDDEIRKSYRKLSLKYHPDRQGGKSEQEKKEAEEKFKKISFAYSILHDSDKRRRYDTTGMTDDNNTGPGAGFDASEIFKNFMHGFSFDDDFDPFGNFFNHHRQTQQPETAQPGKSIRMQVPISIQEIMDGVDKDIRYDIQARCQECHGNGGEGIEICQHCHGTGMLTKTQHTTFGIIQNSSPCPYCQGTGKTMKHVCGHCHGTGLTTKEAKIHVRLNKGVENGHQEIYRSKGYESKDPSMPNGDLLAEFIYQYDQTKFSIQGDTIYELISIPYYDCILGKELEHMLPNRIKTKITIPAYCQDKQPISTGLRFGKLKYSIVIDVKMPTYVNKKEKELLENIRKENK